MNENGNESVGKVPPNDPEAEAGVLGGILIDGVEGCRRGSLSAARAVLAPEDFYQPDHRVIFDAMAKLGAEGKPADLVTVGGQLVAMGEYERMGGNAAIVGLYEKGVTAGLVDFYAPLVKAAARRRKTIAAGRRLIASAYDAAESLEVTLAAAQEGLAVLQREAQIHEIDLEILAGNVLAELDGYQSGARWSTGLDWLDGITGGMGHDQGWIVTGKSGHCKTAFALNIALGIMAQGGAVCFFRWEERPETMVARLASLVSRVPYADVRRQNYNTITDGDVESFRRAVATVGREYRDRLWVYRGLGLAEIEACVANREPWLCVYDTLQAAAMQLPKDTKQRYDLHVASICGTITRLRGQYRHTSLVVSQLNSEGQERESRAIREDNDVSLDLHWPHKEDAKHGAENIIVRFRKNRLGGAEPCVVAHISPGTQRFGALLPPDDQRAFLAKVGD